MIASPKAGRFFTPGNGPSASSGTRRAAGGAPLSSMDRARRLARIRRLAWLLDAAVKVPGTKFRFGLNSVVGAAPGVGDAAMAAVSLYIVYEAYQLGLPKQQIARMVGNVAVEAVAGSVPILGDLFDAAFKANLRNIALIDAHVGPEGRA
ncbi:DUF4112 domain-containing protein [Lichenicola cladoniae]|jgi:hypothetical protein|nr:DUF4112 domain-containing protein [Lichenicola cladoniae]